MKSSNNPDEINEIAIALDNDTLKVASCDDSGST